MSNVNLDIKSIRTNARNTSDKLKAFSDDTTKFLTMLKNVDTAWNDSTTPSFIKTIEKDNEDFNALVKSISNQIAITDNFCDEIESTISNYLDITTLYNIRYISSSTENSISILDEIAKRIENIKSNISTLSIPATSSNRTSVSGLFTDVNSSVIRRTQEKIRKTVASLEKTIENSKYNANKVGTYEMDSSTIKFVSSVQAPDLNRIGEYREERTRAVNANTRTSIENVNIDTDVKGVSYRNQSERANVKTDRLSVNADNDIRFNNKSVKATVQDNPQTAINNSYSFNENLSKAKVDDVNNEKTKEYSHNESESRVDLNNRIQFNTRSDYKNGNASTNVDMSMPQKVVINEYSGPSNNTTEALFESGGVPTDINTYNHNEATQNVSVSNVNAGDVKSYNYGGESVSTKIESNNIKVDNNYKYVDDIKKANIDSVKINIDNKNYQVNNDNVIE